MKTNSPPATRARASVRVLVAVAAAGAMLAACTTTQQLGSAEVPHLTSLVQVDDTVTCTMRDGSTQTIKVTAIEPDALVGEHHERVAVADVTRAEIKHLNMTESIVVGVLVAAGIAAAASGGHGGGMGGGY